MPCFPLPDLLLKLELKITWEQYCLSFHKSFSFPVPNFHSFQLRDSWNETFHLFLHRSSSHLIIQIRLNKKTSYWLTLFVFWPLESSDQEKRITVWIWGERSRTLGSHKWTRGRYVSVFIQTDGHSSSGTGRRTNLDDPLSYCCRISQKRVPGRIYLRIRMLLDMKSRKL